MARVFDHSRDVTIGAGRIFLADLDASGQPGPFRYVGDSEGFSLSVSTTQVDTYTGDGPVAAKMTSKTVQIDNNFSMNLNEVSDDNLALGLLGLTQDRSQASVSTFSLSISSAELGVYYNLGASSSNPAGHKDITSVVVDDGATTTYTLGDDYEVKADTGEVFIKEGGAISAGDAIVIECGVPAKTYKQAVSSENGVGQKALRYEEDASKGTARDVHVPLCDVRPEGSIDFKSRDNIQMVPLQIEALVPADGSPAIVIETRAGTA